MEAFHLGQQNPNQLEKQSEKPERTLLND